MDKITHGCITNKIFTLHHYTNTGISQNFIALKNKIKFNTLSGGLDFAKNSLRAPHFTGRNKDNSKITIQ